MSNLSLGVFISVFLCEEWGANKIIHISTLWIHSLREKVSYKILSPRGPKRQQWRLIFRLFFLKKCRLEMQLKSSFGFSNCFNNTYWIAKNRGRYFSKWHRLFLWKDIGRIDETWKDIGKVGHQTFSVYFYVWFVSEHYLPGSRIFIPQSKKFLRRTYRTGVYPEILVLLSKNGPQNWVHIHSLLFIRTSQT